MARFTKTVSLFELDYVKSRYESAGATVRIFPNRSGGLNQSNYRNLEITPPPNMRDQLRYAKLIRK